MEDPLGVQLKMNNRATAVTLPNNPSMASEGDKNYKMHMRMPAILSNRTVFVSYYFDQFEDGSMLAMGSSRGNEEYEKVYEQEVGSDVIANSILVYLKGVPCEGGYDLTQIVAMDPKGWIPWFIKRKMGHRSAEMIGMTVKYLMTGEVPPPLF